MSRLTKLLLNDETPIIDNLSLFKKYENHMLFSNFSAFIFGLIPQFLSLKQIFDFKKNNIFIFLSFIFVFVVFLYTTIISIYMNLKHKVFKKKIYILIYFLITFLYVIGMDIVNYFCISGNFVDGLVYTNITTLVLVDLFLIGSLWSEFLLFAFCISSPIRKIPRTQKRK